MPWVIHGFNSNVATDRKLIRHGFYISIGIDLLNDISNASIFLPEIPVDRLFFESEDVDIHIEKIYQKAASILELEVITFVKQINKNFKQIFIDRVI